MAINFTKMNSQGNDFIVIDVAHEIFIENQDNIKKIDQPKRKIIANPIKGIVND